MGPQENFIKNMILTMDGVEVKIDPVVDWSVDNNIIFKLNEDILMQKYYSMGGIKIPIYEGPYKNDCIFGRVKFINPRIVPIPEYISLTLPKSFGVREYLYVLAHELAHIIDFKNRSSYFIDKMFQEDLDEIAHDEIFMDVFRELLSFISVDIIIDIEHKIKSFKEE